MFSKVIAKSAVYLPGAMQFTSATDAGWREEIIASLGHAVTFIDPTSEEFKHGTISAAEAVKFFNDPDKSKLRHLAEHRNAVREIINADLRAVVQSKAICCHWSQGAVIGAGVKGELTVAAWHNIPVVFICKDEDYDSVPGWTWGCVTHYVRNTCDAVKVLSQILGVVSTAAE